MSRTPCDPSPPGTARATDIRGLGHMTLHGYRLSGMTRMRARTRGVHAAPRCGDTETGVAMAWKPASRHWCDHEKSRQASVPVFVDLHVSRSRMAEASARLWLMTRSVTLRRVGSIMEKAKAPPHQRLLSWYSPPSGADTRASPPRTAASVRQARRGCRRLSGRDRAASPLPPAAQGCGGAVRATPDDFATRLVTASRCGACT